MNYRVKKSKLIVHPRDAILMGIDRIEHQLTLGSGGPRSSEMVQMVDLILAHQVYYDANLQMYGGINLRREHPSDMVWTDEAKYFTPYTQTLLKERGPPPPESEEAEFTQRVLELKTLYESGGEHLLIVGTDEPVYTSLLPGFAYHRELMGGAMTSISSGLSPSRRGYLRTLLRTSPIALSVYLPTGTLGNTKFPLASVMAGSTSLTPFSETLIPGSGLAK